MPDSFEVPPDQIKSYKDAQVVNLKTFTSELYEDNLSSHLLSKVYNFEQPMLRYRFLLYFRQVRGINPSVGAEVAKGNVEMELHFTLFANEITIPLILLKDTACKGNPDNPYSIVPPEGSYVGKALVLKPFQVLTKSSQGLNYW